MSKHFSLRITLKKSQTQSECALPQFIKKNKILEYLFILEDPDENQENLHWQGAFMSDKKIQSLRHSFKKYFPHLIGNEGYSLKENYNNYTGAKVPCDEGIYHYCCKGTSEDSPLQFEISSFSQNELKTFQKLWWSKKSDIIQLAKVNIKIKKTKTTEFYNNAFKFLYPQLKLDGERCIHNNSRQFIKSSLVDYHIEKKHIFSRNRFQNTFCFILAKVNPDQYREWIKEQIEFI